MVPGPALGEPDVLDEGAESGVDGEPFGVSVGPACAAFEVADVAVFELLVEGSFELCGEVVVAGDCEEETAAELAQSPLEVVREPDLDAVCRVAVVCEVDVACRRSSPPRTGSGRVLSVRLALACRLRVGRLFWVVGTRRRGLDRSLGLCPRRGSTQGCEPRRRCKSSAVRPLLHPARCV